ncbi:OsmC family peroxiredoxin [Idiomarina piscisalsi]|uniref:OsmC family peroxiredoxin n=1 Tax=Idiomarina piscisalsi TaxID=1096243 RepID=A0ABM6LQF2_9GAMM|nr:OsmC family protein [Idiomarina piscisalsi]ASG64698.1 OsmC family peroxiredoxin [Idiomarina piscisalsi]
MKRTANAHWKGSIKEGSGVVSTQSGILDKTQYSFKSRFEEGKGTNPEELIGAAHAGCYAMAFSLMLGEAGYEPDNIDAKAEVSLVEQDDGFAIDKIHLTVKASIPDISDDKFQELANNAKEGCPVSKVLNADISMDASLS